MKNKALSKFTPHLLRKLAQGITQARIGQKKTGHSLSTTEILKFNLDHALARDAIYTPWDCQNMAKELNQNGIDTYTLKTQAANREEYLLNPNLGASLNIEDALALKSFKKNDDIVLIVTDGLSSFAIQKHFCPFFEHFHKKILQKKLTLSPVIFAPYGRVALSDPIGAALGAKISIIRVGERPGLSAADSMGIYLTYDPKPNRHNADRNCISNVRPPFGLSYENASNQLCALIDASLQVGYSGANLKIENLWYIIKILYLLQDIEYFLI